MSNRISQRPTKKGEQLGPDPFASIIMPFAPMMSSKSALEEKLQYAYLKCEGQLLSRCDKEQAELVLARLKKVIGELNYMTHKKSIAIFVSANVEKVYYLETLVHERIRVNQKFEIRNLVNSKKDLHKYLLVVIDEESSKIYQGTGSKISCIISNERHKPKAGDKKEIAGSVPHHLEASENKQLPDRFFKQVYNGLNLVRKLEHLPVFVMGPSAIVESFKRSAPDAIQIIDCVYGEFNSTSQEEIRIAAQPCIKNWKKVKQKDLMHQLQYAMKHAKFSLGITDVRKAANQNRGKVLMVEYNYLTTFYERASEPNPNAGDGSKQTFNFKEVVDEVIEKVIAGGGEVEFIDEGILENEQRIALIHF